MDAFVETIRFGGRRGNSTRELVKYLAEKNGKDTNAALERNLSSMPGSGISYACLKGKKEYNRNRTFRRLLERAKRNLILEA